MVKIQTNPCPRCKNSSIVEMTEEQYHLTQRPKGPHIQDIFPDWTPDQRELLITGYHPECWDADFKEDEEF